MIKQSKIDREKWLFLGSTNVYTDKREMNEIISVLR